MYWWVYDCIQDNCRYSSDHQNMNISFRAYNAPASYITWRNVNYNLLNLRVYGSFHYVSLIFYFFPLHTIYYENVNGNLLLYKLL